METIINLSQIFKMICIIFAIVGFCNVANTFLHLLGRFGKDKLDAEIINKFTLVTPEFMQKNTKEQNIENNQEIHELNKRFIVLEKELQDLRKNK